MPRIKKAAKEVKEQDQQNEEEAFTYEVGYLVAPTVSEDQLSAEVGVLRGSIERGASVPFSEEFPSLRPLAYRLSRSLGGHREHYTEAYFGWVKFDALPGSISGIKKELDGNNRILRYLIVKVARENALEKSSSIRPVLARKRTESTIVRSRPDSMEDKTQAPMSDEELDKTIEELIGQ